MASDEKIALAYQEVRDSGFLEGRHTEMLELIESQSADPFPTIEALRDALRKDARQIDNVKSDLSKLRRRLREYFQSHPTNGQPFTVSAPPYRLEATEVEAPPREAPAPEPVSAMPALPARTVRWVTASVVAMVLVGLAFWGRQAGRSHMPAHPQLRILRTADGRLVPDLPGPLHFGDQLSLKPESASDCHRYLVSIDGAGTVRILSERQMADVRWGWNVEETPPINSLILVCSGVELTPSAQTQLAVELHACGLPRISPNQAYEWNSATLDSGAVARGPRRADEPWSDSVHAVLGRHALTYAGSSFWVEPQR